MSTTPLKIYLLPFTRSEIDLDYYRQKLKIGVTS